ncbi:helix-turn-helix transcriptional regulator [Streptomyces sp. NPDC055243]|uniref:helix-turn-helix transcriptional regulator n=1 Tax=Streptomyces sp. NPDC055243 TaxID=3365720 RepID=UPI0037CCED30
MTLPMTSSAPITPLKPTLQRIAQHLVEGLTTRDIATRTGLSANSIRQYVYEIRRSVHCPPRCKPPVLVHFLCTAKEVELPTTGMPVPDLSPEQESLLQAVAEHSKPRDIALAANIAPADVRSALNELLDKTRTADATQLVVLAHTWGLLGASPTSTVQSGASQ